MRLPHRRTQRITLLVVCLIASLLTLRLQPPSAPQTALAQDGPPSPRPASRSDALFTLFLPFVENYPAIVLLPLLMTPRPGYDWPQFNGDAQHSGNNTAETILNRGNVAGLRPLFKVLLPDHSDAAPVYLGSVPTSLGMRDLIFITTSNGSLLALDAHSGALFWMRSHDNNDCFVLTNPAYGPCFTTSAPAIDPNRQYVYSYGLDGYVHKHQVEDGSEIQGAGWPAMTTAKSFLEKGSSPLSLATARDGVSYLYATHAGYPGPPGPGDAGDYQGHITAINLSDATQHVFNALCSDQSDVHFVEDPYTPDCDEQQAGIWARGSVVYLADNNRIYAATGNGAFDPARHHWSDSLFALNPDGTGQNGNPVDSYTPSNYQELQHLDLDLGSTNVLVLPVPPNSSVTHLGLQTGKDRRLRLLNLDNLSGRGGPGFTGGEIGNLLTFPGSDIRNAQAAWVNPADGSTWVFVSSVLGGLGGYQLTISGSGTPSLTAKWFQDIPATSPLVASGILYTAASHRLTAHDPLSGATLWATSQVGSIHWQSPVVVNGVLYLTDQDGYLNAFALPAAH